MSVTDLPDMVDAVFKLLCKGLIELCEFVLLKFVTNITVLHL